MLGLFPVFFLVLLVLFVPVFSVFVFIFVFVRIVGSEIRLDLGVVVQLVPAHAGGCGRGRAERSEAGGERSGEEQN